MSSVHSVAMVWFNLLGWQRSKQAVYHKDSVAAGQLLERFNKLESPAQCSYTDQATDQGVAVCICNMWLFVYVDTTPPLAVRSRAGRHSGVMW